ncbi:MAG: DJ-1 family protein [Verrucomicrobia bacterium]|nr:MAG: DJ-1 family protein [Verrucomicrobiota bacterium]
MPDSPKSALILIGDGVEEMEAVAPIDLLRRAGVDVTVASITGNRRITGRNAIVIEADTLLQDVTGSFDGVVIPGGPGIKAVRAESKVIECIRKQAKSGRLVAAICAAPTVLLDAGVLEGRRYTAHFGVAGELPDIIEDAPVVIDGNIVTSRGAGTATDFGLTLVELLCSESVADEVANSICVPELG